MNVLLNPIKRKRFIFWLRFIIHLIRGVLDEYSHCWRAVLLGR